MSRDLGAYRVLLPIGEFFRSITLNRAVFWIVLAVASFFSSYRSYVFSALHPDPAMPGDSEQMWTELKFWLFAVCLVLWLMVREGRLGYYLRQWYAQPFLMMFLSVCVLSIGWSEAPAVTSFRVVVLMASTWTAAYVGMRCTIEEIVRFLSWLAVCVAIWSIYFAVLDPSHTGLQEFYGPGVWRGIFWNRNHLGTVAAFLSVLLALRLIDVKGQPGRLSRLFFFGTYIASLFLVYKSKSTTGALVTIIAHAVCGLAILWTIFETRMRRTHYLILIFASVFVLAMFLINLEHVFGLFNRDFRLSGRVGLWGYLFKDVISQKPMLGYGLGSLWSDPTFRQAGKHLIGSDPLIGDNGFLDILMGVGAVGLIAFAAVFVVAWKKAIEFLIWRKDVASVFPLAVVVCSLLSNLTFSLLMEIEVLIWCLIVVVLFATSDRSPLIGTFSSKDNRYRLHQNGEVVP